MSDDRDLLERLTEQLAKRQASHACPMCRTERWGLLRSSPSDATFPAVVGLTEPRAYALVCLQCGFVRQHVAEILDKDGDAEGGAP